MHDIHIKEIDEQNIKAIKKRGKSMRDQYNQLYRANLAHAQNVMAIFVSGNILVQSFDNNQEDQIERAVEQIKIALDNAKSMKSLRDSAV